MQKINQSPPVVAITPSDTTTYDPPLSSIRVGTLAGAVKVRSGGADVTIPAVQVGETIHGEFNMVYATGTAATGITGTQWPKGN